MQRLILASALSLLALPAAALPGASDPATDQAAATEQTGPDAAAQALFNAADTNGDGTVDSEEASAAGIQDFGAADEDGDGELDTQEFDTGLSESAQGGATAPGTSG